MAKHWIAVVTRVEARILDRKDFSLINTLSNELGREKNRAMTTGRPGYSRGKHAANLNIHALTGERSPHEEAAMAFAREVSFFLARNFTQHRFRDVLVVAEPKMMGRLRKNFPRALLEHSEFQAKDLGRVSTHDLREMISSSSHERSV